MPFELRGEIDFLMNFSPPLIVAIDAGEPITLLAGEHIGCFELFARGGIRTIPDLKGKNIGVQSLGWALEHEVWQGRAGTIRGAHEAAAKDLGEPEVNSKVCRALWNKVVPGILDQFDCPSMIRLFAGRPMLITSGEKDPNNPLGGAKLAFALPWVQVPSRCCGKACWRVWLSA